MSNATPIVEETHHANAEAFMAVIDLYVGQLEVDIGAFLFRGVNNADHELLPSAFRQNGTIYLNQIGKLYSPQISAKDGVDDVNRRLLEAYALTAFYGFAERLGIPVPAIAADAYSTFFRYAKTSEDWDALGIRKTGWPTPELAPMFALAQHHGVPTRLLDWSLDPLVACYFAASKALQSLATKPNTRLAVWVASSRAVESGRLASGLPSAKGMELPWTDVVRVASAGNQNLSAQRGRFTVAHTVTGAIRPLDHHVREMRDHWPEIIKDLDSHGKKRVEGIGWAIRKNTLAATEAPALLRLLKKRGYEAFRIFPSFDGCARAIEDSILLSNMA